MIHVVRPAEAPLVLINDGIPKARDHCNEYSAGAKEFEFDGAIYAHSNVKDALVLMHHGKCGYCESYVRHVSFGTIDHHRPKAASHQETGHPFIRPGYYWLAYDWENLIFLCQICNQSFKRNQFPLENPADRAGNHLCSIQKEIPLLINVTKEDPSEFIAYRAEFIFPIDDNLRGRKTIEVLQLNDRNDLVEARRQKLKTLKTIFDLIVIMPESTEAENALEFLSEALNDGSEYAAMARSFFAQYSSV